MFPYWQDLSCGNDLNVACHINIGRMVRVGAQLGFWSSSPQELYTSGTSELGLKYNFEYIQWEPDEQTYVIDIPKIVLQTKITLLRVRVKHHSQSFRK